MNIVDTYDSVGEFMAQANSAKQRHTSVSTDRPEWFGTASLEQAIGLVQEGWDTRPDLSKLSSDIESHTSSEVATLNLEHQVQGAYVDVGAYLEGVPECMVQFVEQPEPKVVKLAFNISTSGSMSRDAFANRGAVTLAICNKLQMAGYSVEIIAYECCQNRVGSKHFVSWVLKSSAQPFDEGSLAFWCCHPSALRRIHFLYCESMDEKVRREFDYNGGGYSKPCPLIEHKQAMEAIKPDVNIDFRKERFEDAVKEYDKLVAKLNEKLAS